MLVDLKAIFNFHHLLHLFSTIVTIKYQSKWMKTGQYFLLLFETWNNLFPVNHVKLNVIVSSNRILNLFSSTSKLVIISIFRVNLMRLPKVYSHILNNHAKKNQFYLSSFAQPFSSYFNLFTVFIAFLKVKCNKNINILIVQCFIIKLKLGQFLIAICIFLAQYLFG